MPDVMVEKASPAVSLITLNRPDKLNALTVGTVLELHDVLDTVAADPESRVVILTGAGRAFCAGLDLKGPGAVPGSEDLGAAQAGMRLQEAFAGLITHVRSLPQPVISAVNGAAVGAGFALVLGSDLRIAAESARFNVANVRIGLSGGECGMSWLLPRIVGPTRAFELMLTGRFVGADEAERLGMVLEVVADGGVVEAALALADQVCANSPFGIWMTKDVMWAGLETPSLQAALDLENRTQILCSMTDDSDEARRAFLEKRAPRYANR